MGVIVCHRFLQVCAHKKTAIIGGFLARPGKPEKEA